MGKKRLIFLNLVLAFSIFAQGRAIAAVRCEKLFTGDEAVVAELADLRVTADTALAHGNTELARIYYLKFRERMIEASALGIDLALVQRLTSARRASVEKDRGKEEVRRANAREEERRHVWFAHAQIDFLVIPAISADGTRVAVPHGKTIEIWDMQTRELLSTIATPYEMQHVSFSPDGKSLVAMPENLSLGNEDDTQTPGIIYDVTNGHERRKLNVGQGYVEFTWTADSNTLAARWMNIVSGFDIYKVSEKDDWNRVAFQPTRPTRHRPLNHDGSRLVEWRESGGDTKVLDSKTRAKLFTLTGGWPSYSADGSHILTTRKDMVYLWDAVTGAPMTQFKVDGNKRGGSVNLALSASSDLARVAVQKGETLDVWDTASGRLLFNLTLPTAKPIVERVLFADDGRSLVIANATKSGLDFYSYDLADGRLVSQIDGGAYRFNWDSDLRLSPDGTQVIVSHSDHKVHALPFPDLKR